ncbi:MAG: RNA methyltransferase [Pseudomonadota bacterium]
MSATYDIDHVGSLGDGVAVAPSLRHIPFTLPGERVSVKGTDNERLVVEDPSPDRIKPSCPHFGTCGGCQLQHWSPGPYLAWKRDLVTRAFARQKIDATIDSIVGCPPASRRRATFTARKVEGKTRLGFMERKSERLVAIGPCPVLRPSLEAALSQLTDLAATILRGNEDLSVAVLDANNGIAVSLVTEQTPSADMVTALVNVAAKAGFIQVAMNGDVVFERAAPVVSFGAAAITPPPGGFLQAVREAEDAMSALVVDHLSRAKRVADLFSGSGTFAARLAARSRVHAVEAQSEALTALSSASLPDGAKPLTTETRDLHDAPLHADELNRFDGLCLDPPRAGAAAQVEQIAKSTVPKLAYVSCDPKSLARDLAVLLKGGYRLKRVVPFDQFLFTPHVEVIALLSKPKNRAKRSIFR